MYIPTYQVISLVVGRLFKIAIFLIENSTFTMALNLAVAPIGIDNMLTIFICRSV